MTTAVALAVVVLVLAVTNAWVHAGPRLSRGLGPRLGPRLGSGLVLGGVHLLTGPLAALFLLLIGRVAGLTWTELGLGLPSLIRGMQVAALCVVAVAGVYAVGVAVPVTRGAFRDTRYRLGLRAALYTSLVAIPLGTVLFEEVAFRGVLWGLLAEAVGVTAATLVSAILFGLWHVLPALDLVRTHTSVRGPTPAGPRRVALTVLATIAFTTIAGILFAELRRRSGSLVAPIGLHWATNGLGVLAAARVWAMTPGEVAAPGESATSDQVVPPSWQRIVSRMRSGRR
jgi:membrane protease YdiL (CAAX protease family)